jgi:hypothetical protein
VGESAREGARGGGAGSGSGRGRGSSGGGGGGGQGPALAGCASAPAFTGGADWKQGLSFSPPPVQSWAGLGRRQRQALPDDKPQSRRQQQRAQASLPLLLPTRTICTH